MSEKLVVGRRYQGLAHIAHGGYVSGALAAMVGGSAEVSLRGIVPMDRPLEVERPEPDRVVLSAAGDELAEARRMELELDVPAPVGLAEAKAVSASYPGFAGHFFPHCFACGPARDEGDGLRVFPGPVAGRGLVAAPWAPDRTLADEQGRVLPEYLWAALDCPQLWALIVDAAVDSEERVVTAGMTARLQAPVKAGAPHVIMAWPMRREGRSLFAGAALLSEQGQLLVAARQRAVAVRGEGVPLGLGSWGGRARADV